MNINMLCYTRDKSSTGNVGTNRECLQVSMWRCALNYRGRSIFTRRGEWNYLLNLMTYWIWEKNSFADQIILTWIKLFV